MASPWTQDHAGVLRELEALTPGGGNAVLDAVQLVLPTFELARHQRKVLLLISDGNDAMVPDGFIPPAPYRIGNPTADRSTSRQVLRQQLIGTAKSAIRRSGALVYAIGARKDVQVDMALLGDLTTESGGYVEQLRDRVDISAAVARICDHLESQYLLAFEPRHAWQVPRDHREDHARRSSRARTFGLCRRQRRPLGRQG